MRKFRNFQVFSNHIDRQVELRPIDDWIIERENKAIVTMESDVIPSDWDWIGLFKVNKLQRLVATFLKNRIYAL